MPLSSTQPVFTKLNFAPSPENLIVFGGGNMAAHPPNAVMTATEIAHFNFILLLRDNFIFERVLVVVTVTEK